MQELSEPDHDVTHNWGTQYLTFKKKKKKLGEGAHPLTSQAKDQTQATAVTQAAAVAKQDP